MTNEQKQKYKDYQKQYRENMADEQKQRYKENMTDEEKQKYKQAKNKRNRDRYNKMIDEKKQKHRKKIQRPIRRAETKKKRLSKTIYRKYKR